MSKTPFNAFILQLDVHMVSKHCPCFQVLAHPVNVCTCQYHPRLKAVSSGAAVDTSEVLIVFAIPSGEVTLSHWITADPRWPQELNYSYAGWTTYKTQLQRGMTTAARLSQPDHRSAVKGWILNHVVLRCDERRGGTFAFPRGWVFCSQRLIRIVPHCFAMGSTFSQRMAWKDYFYYSENKTWFWYAHSQPKCLVSSTNSWKLFNITSYIFALDHFVGVLSANQQTIIGVFIHWGKVKHCFHCHTHVYLL